MKIEAITVCVNYSDFLAASLPVNRRQFDYMCVATDSKDGPTVQTCYREKVSCLPMRLCEVAGGVFSKTLAINEVLGNIFTEDVDWVCVLDADTVLPLNFRETIMQCARVGALDPTCIYGIDRLMCRSYEAWTKYIGRLRHPDPRFVTTEDFPIGKRYSHFGRDGWAPMGFFQMWNPRGSGIRQYPEGDAMALCDLKFAQKWPRAKRVLLPEIVAVHLESEACEFGEKLARAKNQAVRGCAIRSQKFRTLGREIVASVR